MKVPTNPGQSDFKIPRISDGSRVPARTDRQRNHSSPTKPCPECHFQTKSQAKMDEHYKRCHQPPNRSSTSSKTRPRNRRLPSTIASRPSSHSRAPATLSRRPPSPTSESRRPRQPSPPREQKLQQLPTTSGGRQSPPRDSSPQRLPSTSESRQPQRSPPRASRRPPSLTSEIESRRQSSPPREQRLQQLAPTSESRQPQRSPPRVSTPPATLPINRPPSPTPSPHAPTPNRDVPPTPGRWWNAAVIDLHPVEGEINLDDAPEEQPWNPEPPANHVLETTDSASQADVLIIANHQATQTEPEGGLTVKQDRDVPVSAMTEQFLSRLDPANRELLISASMELIIRTADTVFRTAHDFNIL